MAARNHLSIGEVLSLLREEFPDVTISKIRFLESQGLVDPERTPSGYRKFYDPDVDRLRWILRQQREHFLPLKVIKGRLLERSTEGAPEGAIGEGAIAEGATPGSATPGSATPGVGGSSETFAVRPTSTENPTTQPAPTESLEVQEDNGTRHNSGQHPAQDDQHSPGEPPLEDVAQARVPGMDQYQTSGPAGADLEPAGSRATGSATDQSPAETTVVDPGDDGVGDKTERDKTERDKTERQEEGLTSRSPNEDADLRPSKRPVRGAHGGGRQTFTAEELASAAGTDVEMIVELQQYGILSRKPPSGSRAYFNSDALEVAKAAVGFARHGVEARHLRPWRNSADREVSLFEQVVMPLLRQRNPEARDQAQEILDELEVLGSTLRAALVHQAIREIR